MSVDPRLESALRSYVDPLIGMDLLAAGAVQRADAAVVELELRFPAAGYADTLRAALGERLRAAGLTPEIRVNWRVPAHAARNNLPGLPQVRNIIAVASGKGGVGKSTVAANLALALAAEGARVGMLDADLYGPSQPQMLGTHQRPTSPDGKLMDPVIAHGIQAMSIGFLIDASQATIWRGPMATAALMQLLTETRWHDLDYLIVDMPPGTGDIALTLSQRIPLSGAVIVTTPQDIALIDARKGLEMFKRVAVSVLGVIENMSLFCCPHCGRQTAIFGEGGGERLARDTGVGLLGRLMLDARIREQADSGRPTVIADPRSDAAQAYRDIARRTAARLAYGVAEAFPQIEIGDD